MRILSCFQLQQRILAIRIRGIFKHASQRSLVIPAALRLKLAFSSAAWFLYRYILSLSWPVS